MKKEQVRGRLSLEEGLFDGRLILKGVNQQCTTQGTRSKWDDPDLDVLSPVDVNMDRAPNTLVSHNATKKPRSDIKLI